MFGRVSSGRGSPELPLAPAGVVVVVHGRESTVQRNGELYAVLDVTHLSSWQLAPDSPVEP